MEEEIDSSLSPSRGVNGNEGLADDFRGLMESSVIGGTEHLRLKRQFEAVQKLWVYFTPDGKVW